MGVDLIRMMGLVVATAAVYRKRERRFLTTSYGGTAAREAK
jgi:hypothetical protein